MNPAGDITLADMLKDLAERVGEAKWGTGADNRITIPADPAMRDRLIRSLNSGRRELYSRLPQAHCFQPILTMTLNAAGTGALNIGADPAKYRLPYAVEGLAGGQWNWKTSDQSGWGGTVRQVHQSDVSGLHSAASSANTQGLPQVMAFALGALNGPNEPGRRTAHFLWVWPKPDLDYIIEGQARIIFSPLTELDDLEPMGQGHVESVLTFAERAWHVGRCDPEQWATLQQRAETAIDVSRDIDNQQRAQTLGAGFDPEAERDALKYTRGRPSGGRWATVSHVSGIEV